MCASTLHVPRVQARRNRRAATDTDTVTRVGLRRVRGVKPTARDKVQRHAYMRGWQTRARARSWRALASAWARTDGAQTSIDRHHEANRRFGRASTPYVHSAQVVLHMHHACVDPASHLEGSPARQILRVLGPGTDAHTAERPAGPIHCGIPCHDCHVLYVRTRELGVPAADVLHVAS